MGGVCCKDEGKIGPPAPKSEAVPDYRKDLEDTRSILKLQESEIDVQSKKCTQLTADLSTLQKKVREADHVLLTSSEKQLTLKTALELEELSRELGKFPSVIEKSREDCNHADKQLTLLSESAASAPPTFQEDIDAVKESLTRLHNDLTRSHKTLKAMEDKLTTLQQQYETEDTKRLHQIQERTNKFERVLKVPARWIKDKLRRTWLLWKSVPVQETATIEIFENQGAEEEVQESVTVPERQEVEVAAIALEPEVSQDELDPILQEEFDYLRSNNPLNAIPQSDDQILDKDLLAALLSESLIARAKDSSEDTDFPQFFSQFLSATHPEASLDSVVSSVSRLATNEDRLGLVLSSLLQVGTVAPLSRLWSVRISSMFASACDLITKRQLRGYGNMSLDGRAFLSDLLSLAYLHLGTNWETGETLLRLLKPQSISPADFALFVLAHKMKQKNVESLGLFRKVDTAGKGRIELAQFVPGVKEVLGVWLSSPDLFALVQELDKDHSGDVSRIEFLKLNFKTYFQNAQSELYTASLLDLLCALRTAFLSESRRMVKVLRDFIGLESTFSEAEFFGKIKSVDFDAQESYMQMLRTETTALSESQIDSIPASAVVRVMLRHEVFPSSR